MMSSEIVGRGTFCGTEISKNGRSEAVACVWQAIEILLKVEEDLNGKLKRVNV